MLLNLFLYFLYSTIFQYYKDKFVGTETKLVLSLHPYLPNKTEFIAFNTFESNKKQVWKLRNGKV